MKSALSVFTGQGIAIQIFIVILLTAIVYFIVYSLLRCLKKQTEKTKNMWDSVLVNAIHKPLGFLIWFLGVSYALDILRIEENGAAIFHAIGPLREVTVIAIIVWFLIRLVHEFESAYLRPKDGQIQKNVDKTTVNALSQILRVAIVITAILVTMDTLGYNISSLLALGGVGTLIVGLAGKDLLANFFGGLMIYLDRPFKVGDWIRSPDRNIEGTVEYIGWRLCRIRTFDKRPLYVPNGVFSNISVENPSRMLNRRIYTNIGVRYDDAPKIRAIVTEIKRMLTNHPEIDTKSTLIVNLVEFAPSSLNIMVYTFTKTTHWVKFQEVQQDVFLKIIDVITAQGAECAFPSTTVYIPEDIHLSRSNALKAKMETTSS